MPNMNIDIDHIATLALLHLSEEEQALYSQEIPSIVAYVSKLQEVDTQNAQSSAYISKRTNVLRPDTPVQSTKETRDALVNAFPKHAQGALEVPAIFE